MGFMTTLERLEEVEFELTKAKAVAASRGRCLELAERRIDELEQANKQLLQKLTRGTE
jgi:hypothetical protein